MATCLVTGGAGFLGSHLCEELLERGHRVICIDNLETGSLVIQALARLDASVAWQTGLWYWMTQTGPGSMTPHAAIANGAGFGETIRSINGSLECNGGNPAQVQSRVNAYNKFTGILGVSPGSNLSC